MLSFSLSWMGVEENRRKVNSENRVNGLCRYANFPSRDGTHTREVWENEMPVMVVCYGGVEPAQ